MGGFDSSFQELMILSEAGRMMSEWNDIPLELLLQILALAEGHSRGREPIWLGRSSILASGVCSAWRESIFLGLTHLSLSWCRNSMNHLVSSLAPKLTKLKSVCLRQDKPQLEDNAVQAVASYCHDLQELDLSKSFKLTDNSFYALAHGCPNLKKLNISGCSSFGDAALEYLTRFCPNMEDLNLCGCARAASDTALQAIGRNCKGLEVLNLGWCDNVTDSGVTSLANGCPQLRALDLCGCILITDNSVIAMANRCPHLQCLGLYFCRNITDKAMYSLAHNGMRRKEVKWESLKSRCKEEGLRQLNISQCTALTPPAVQAVCDSFPALHTCPRRHSLMMSGCLHLTSVHCACALQSHRVHSMLQDTAH